MEEYSDHVKERLFESPNKEVWLSLAENNVAESIKAIKNIFENPKTEKRFFGLIKTTLEIQGRIVLQSALEILEMQNLSMLDSLNFNLDSRGDMDFAELVRFLSALNSSGNFKPETTAVAKIALQNLEKLAQETENRAGNYPDNPISADVWMGGMFVREWSDPIAEFFAEEGETENELRARFSKCKITNSIMSHYPHLVGPDMLAVGKCYEKLNDTDKAKRFFNPVVLDFERFLQEYTGNKEIPDEEDASSLLSLLGAYTGLERVAGTDFSERIKAVEEILKRAKIVTN